MDKSSYALTRLSFLAGLLVVSCTADDRTPLTTEPAATERAAPTQSEIRPGEERFVRMAEIVPGFAGYYYDDAGDLVIASTNSGAEAAARKAALTVLQDLPPQRGKGAIMFRQAQYTFSQLAAWRDVISGSFLGTRGLISVDADEVRNRVTLGVDKLARQGELIAAIVNKGIPPAALAFEQTYEAEPEDWVRADTDVVIPPPGTEVTSYFEPVPGGVMISYRIPFITPPDSADYCTMGFGGKSLNPTVRASRGDSIFMLTASHCSSKFWGLYRGIADSTDYYQPTAAHKYVSFNPQYYLGREKLDPDSLPCCVDHYWYRYTDALLADVRETRHLFIGRVAKPQFYQTPRSNGLPGSFTIDQSDPYFYVTRQETSVPVGSVVDKVGIRTGWTRGTVNSTCVDRWNATTKYKWLCNTLAYYWSDKGDSGAPVFIVLSGNQIAAVGIHWGGFGVPLTAGSATFSPLGTIQRGDELGTLRLFP